MVSRSTLLCLLLGLSVLWFISPSFGAVTFTDIEASLPTLAHCAVAWGDYDSDGDLDLAVAGLIKSDYPYALITRIYRNDSGKLVDIQAAIPAVDFPSLAWGDYDNDGDLDLALMGSGDAGKISRIYRNDAGQFSDIGADLLGFSGGTAAWGDYDNDGDLDLVLTGAETSGRSGIPMTKIYRNDSGRFIDIGAKVLPAAYSSVAWGDYDNDGDLDLVVAGGGTTVARATRICRNDQGTFTVGEDLAGAMNCSVAWGDYDNDGDLDLVVAGFTNNIGPATIIYRNDDGKFTNIGAGIVGVDFASAAWGDYDNDGDLDLAVAGQTATGPASKVYRNDGNGTFTDAAANLVGVRNCSLAWGDYDNDGDLDLVVAGETLYGRWCSIYRSDGAPVNSAPSAPTGPSASSVGRAVTFSWNAASDDHTPTNGLSYNLRVGSTPGASDVFSGMADPVTGRRHVPAAGNAQKRLSWTLKGLGSGTYYWSVQAIDTAFAGSSWSEEQTAIVDARRISGYTRDTGGQAVPGVALLASGAADPVISDNTGYYELWVSTGWSGTVTPSAEGYTFSPPERSYTSVTSDQTDRNYTVIGGFRDIGAGLVGTYYSALAWGDYDNDGDLDLAVAGVAGTNGYVTRIYRNDNGAFTDIEAGIVGVNQGSLAWADYDNDGDLDLAVAGRTALEPVTRIYRNDGGKFVDISAGLLGCGNKSALAWGDYDNDGDLDLVVVGTKLIGAGEFPAAVLYRNDDGKFMDANAGFAQYRRDYGAAWGDYDNDGDLDLALGYHIYRNDRGKFTDIATGLTGGWPAWGDYDNDGDLDLVVVSSLDYPVAIKLFRNDGGKFVDSGATLAGYANQPVWCDYDNDGDLDIGCGSRINRNDGGVFVDIDAPIAIPNGPIQAWGDFDNDGDLDVAVAGTDASHVAVTKIYRNNGGMLNTIPAAPTALSTKVFGRKVLFEWSPGSDRETSPNGLSYNLRVGTTPGGGDVFSGMANLTTGLRLLPATGNAQKRLSWALKDLASGNCYWSVQAIDTAFAGSPWAPEQSVVVNPKRISGQVRAIRGPGIEGVEVSTNDDGEPTTTDSDGNYEIWITPGWTGEVTPSKAGYQFDPLSRAYANVTEDTTGQDFLATGGIVDSGITLPGLKGCTSMAWGDYDRDGDLDLAVSGFLSSGAGVTRIYRNDSGIFADTDAGLVQMNSACLAWGDLDNDGDLDLAVAGLGTSFASRVYRNDNGTFTDIGAPLAGTNTGLAWGDYDGDGDQDLVVGASNQSKIFRNDKGVLVDSGIVLARICGKSFAWGDYDSDGDLDLLAVGTNGYGVEYTKLFRNDGGTMVDTQTPLTAVDGSAAWGDYDNDGDPDLLLAGSTTSITGVTRIFRNDSGALMDSGIDIPAIKRGCAAWGDYDNDGDLDLVLAGRSSAGRITKVYRNDAGAFSDSGADLLGVSPCSLACGDYDGDGDLDLIVAGTFSDYSDQVITIYRNDGGVFNTPPSAPTGLTALVGRNITFKWSAAADAETPSAGLSYNLRIGTAPGKEDVYCGMADPASGFRYIPANGDAQQGRLWKVSGLTNGSTYYWSVQAVDAAFAGGQWADEQTLTINRRKISGYVRDPNGVAVAGVVLSTSDGSDTATTDDTGYYDLIVGVGWSGTVLPTGTHMYFEPGSRSYSNVTEDQVEQDYVGKPPFTEMTSGLPAMKMATAAWGDYDGDGRLDVAMAGMLPPETTYATRIYHNEGGTFVDTGAALFGSFNTTLGWGDYDNDGDLDLAVSVVPPPGPTMIYRNDGGVFSMETMIRGGLLGGSSAWVDYDNDGDLDLAVEKWRTGSECPCRIYRNDRGSFTEVDAGLPGFADTVISVTSLAWGDYDNDGDMDAAISIGRVGGYILKVYRNDGGWFTEADSGLPNLRASQLSWCDYDNDGDLDLAAIDYINGADYRVRLFRNDSGVFTDTGLDQRVEGSLLAWGDYDNDGDQDLAVYSYVYVYPYFGIRLFRNDRGVLQDSGIALPCSGSGSAIWGDYDADGRLDLLTVGTDMTGLYHNNCPAANTPPSAPSGLVGESAAGVLKFSWNAATDSETPVAGLSYNLRVGTSPEASDIFSGMADPITGVRYLPAQGNAQKRLSWTLKNLPPATYYWSVQAIDPSFAGSQWAAEQCFQELGIIKWVADGTVVHSSGVVTAVFDDAFYVEKDDRSCGIRVETQSHNVMRGRRVRMSGTTFTNADGERSVAATSVTDVGECAVPKPLLMNINALGGGPFGLQSGINEWRLTKDPVTGEYTRTLAPCVGANNIGLLVKVTGFVSHAGRDCFYLAASNGPGADEVADEVDWPFAASMPKPGTFVELTAVSSCRSRHGDIIRLLRPISAEAVRPLAPRDEGGE